MIAVESWAMTALAYPTVRMIWIASTFPGNSGNRGRHSEIDIAVDRDRLRRLIGGEEERRAELLCFRYEPSIKNAVRPDRRALRLA
jgi:hypothetical protein